jgi:redox-sensitive bicupin YhaK (pirin superfamily)
VTFLEAPEPACRERDGSIALRIEPVTRDLGDFSVRRVLPSPERRAVGPFVFFDHMGPAVFPPGKGIQVRPHPHIGLATVTYLFEGEIMHRDSLGCVQSIAPGAVNLMTAGGGIVHSERAGDDLDRTSRLHGIQTWMALPSELEEIEPAFVHYPAAALPEFEIDAARLRLIIGEAYGARSPVTVLSPMLYLDGRLPAGSCLELPPGDELACYVVEGAVGIDGETYGPGVKAVCAPGARPALQALADSRVMLLGGAPLGRRYIWWNFVSSSRVRLEAAKRAWAEGGFGLVPGDDEFIPLPDR